jgi:hypothetical protein
LTLATPRPRLRNIRFITIDNRYTPPMHEGV